MRLPGPGIAPATCPSRAFKVPTGRHLCSPGLDLAPSPNSARSYPGLTNKKIVSPSRFFGRGIKGVGCIESFYLFASGLIGVRQGHCSWCPLFENVHVGL